MVYQYFQIRSQVATTKIFGLSVLIIWNQLHLRLASLIHILLIGIFLIQLPRFFLIIALLNLI